MLQHWGWSSFLRKLIGRKPAEGTISTITTAFSCKIHSPSPSSITYSSCSCCLSSFVSTSRGGLLVCHLCPWGIGALVHDILNSELLHLPISCQIWAGEFQEMVCWVTWGPHLFFALIVWQQLYLLPKIKVNDTCKSGDSFLNCWTPNTKTIKVSRLQT